MSWNCSLIADGEIVCLEFSGVLTSSGACEGIDAAAELLKNQSFPAVLIDRSGITEIEPHSDLDIFQTHEHMTKAYPPGTRVVILAGTVEAPPEEINFANMICTNRGLNVRRLTSRDEALQWLRQSRNGIESPAS